MTDPQAPDIAGLSGTEALFRILAHAGEPMTAKAISEWLVSNAQPMLSQGQVAGGLYRLTNAYSNVVEKVGRGEYRIHPAWNRQPLDQQAPLVQHKAGKPVAKTGKPSTKVGKMLIPAYGLYWHRDQVEWGGRADLLGQSTANDETINFAEQSGVYILYNWPNITYVGRTTNDLYGRLKDHTSNDRRANEWDRFSWFGLRPVDDDALGEPRLLDAADMVAAFETLLIRVLSPPFNDKSGDGLGDLFLQVPDAAIEEQEQNDLKARMKEIWKNV